MQKRSESVDPKPTATATPAVKKDNR